ncbi:tryptophan--tRNA ligase [Paenibacillus sp. CAA11]|uniref:tryptophan--tRNA ligase n=1 Tax=Paenibacillus sp. CAA11 TaxID=1532905 RepID=UPI000D37357D|nr:tryptophan--tRNA ligase [Paenibacillus sp. CAA11]AWB45899.1 tryptophan--tRNA ligase [Paenibacillus sp. CAA11]
MKTVFSGVQPSGNLTIGNYLGAIRNFVELQHDYACNFVVVDLHAITVPQDPAALREQSESVASLYVAVGVDPQKANIYMQSHVPQHAELGWLLTTLTSMGELERMTQFKDKSSGKESVGAGLFVYPSLMAADILLFNTDLVPVGEDQKQHLELARDIAGRFNHRYGEFFHIPEGYTPKVGARIMSLDDASKKMSKSNPNEGSRINMLDAPDVIRKKISRATTDSGKEVRYDPAAKPEVSNLISIYSEFSGLSIAEVEQRYEGQMYGPFKKELAEVVVSVLEPIQQRYHEIRKSGEIHEILRQGADRARETAERNLKLIYERMGFIPKA